MSVALEMVVFSVIAILGVAAMATISLLRRPSWLEQDKALQANWKRIVGYSVVTGLGLGVAALVINLEAGWGGQSIVFASLGGYLFFQSLFTDFRLRLVDRWVQRAANVIALGVGIYILSQFGVELDWILFLVFTVATLAIGFLPGVGDSDGRAFVYLVLASYPVAGVAGVQWAAVIFVATLTLYFLGYSIWKKNLTIQSIFTKVSFPVVPLIMLPALVVTLFGRALPGF